MGAYIYATSEFHSELFYFDRFYLNDGIQFRWIVAYTIYIVGIHFLFRTVPPTWVTQCVFYDENANNVQKMWIICFRWIKVWLTFIVRRVVIFSRWTPGKCDILLIWENMIRGEVRRHLKIIKCHIPVEAAVRFGNFWHAGVESNGYVQQWFGIEDRYWEATAVH